MSPFEIALTPPAYTPAASCAPLPYSGENATNDICQVQVVVSNVNGSSAESTILPPYEGAFNLDNLGALVLPPGCGCEDEQQPTEFDYLPAPTITSVSTGTVSTPVPAQLASEFGGAATNVVVLSGAGMNALTLSYLTLGSPASENSIFFAIGATGTSITLVAPPLLAPGGTPTTGPFALPEGFSTAAGVFAPGSTPAANIVYAGVPQVASVVNDDNATTVGGLYGASDLGGTHVT
jgi:hypothetical protein